METLKKNGARAVRFLYHHPLWYAWFGSAILLSSSLWWGILGARLQQGNADQLADGYLFASGQTFAHALFPASHTLLLKWPLFWLLQLFNFSPAATGVSTVLLVLISVVAFAFLLYRIVPRPLAFGSLCLVLACVLVLVPAQIFNGVTAPLNMALLTGRNIEYLLYIGILVLYIRAKNFTGREWANATALLILLLASDQLFVTLSIGGAAVTLAVGHMWQHKQLLQVSKRWLMGSVAAWLLAKLLLWFVGNHITGIAAGVGPYGLIDSGRTVWPATVYAIKALILNLGITTRSGGLAVVPALLNAAAAALLLWASYAGIRKVRQAKTSAAGILAVLLLASTLAALVAYVATAHFYAADGRYLTIALFAGFVALAVYLRTARIAPRVLVASGGLSLLAIILGLASVHHYTNHTIAADPLRLRNQRIAQVLQTHPTEILVGDYWRVLPVKSMTPGSQQQIIPLQNCFQPIGQLRSDAWLKDLRVHRFAYLLPMRNSGTPFGICDLHAIEARYGRPTATAVISGTQHSPKELLLFYDNGAKTIGR